MRASLIMIIITAVSICLFIPETTPLPPETDYANTPEESGIYNSDTEKLPALSENTDTQSTEASYADIVLEEAFRTIRADYHTFISETRKDEAENDISGDSDNGSIQKDGDIDRSCSTTSAMYSHHAGQRQATAYRSDRLMSPDRCKDFPVPRPFVQHR